jgi:small subunit ribosomal protein S4
MLNGKRFDIPSLRLKPGDELELRAHSKKSDYFVRLDDTSPAVETVSWLTSDRKKITLKVVALPNREEAEPDINEQLIVEYYSR